MNETLTDQPEREPTEEELKRAEAAHIAEIVGCLQEAFRGKITGEQAGDWALDDVQELCESLAKRDPELGTYIVEAMEAHEVASTDPHPVDDIRKVLGMPVEYSAEYEAWRQTQAALHQTSPQADRQPPVGPSPEHRE